MVFDALQQPVQSRETLQSAGIVFASAGVLRGQSSYTLLNYVL